MRREHEDPFDPDVRHRRHVARETGRRNQGFGCAMILLALPVGLLIRWIVYVCASAMPGDRFPGAVGKIGGMLALLAGVWLVVLGTLRRYLNRRIAMPVEPDETETESFSRGK